MCNTFFSSCSQYVVHILCIVLLLWWLKWDTWIQGRCFNANVRWTVWSYWGLISFGVWSYWGLILLGSDLIGISSVHNRQLINNRWIGSGSSSSSSSVEWHISPFCVFSFFSFSGFTLVVHASAEMNRTAVFSSSKHAFSFWRSYSVWYC